MSEEITARSCHIAFERLSLYLLDASAIRRRRPNWQHAFFGYLTLSVRVRAASNCRSLVPGLFTDPQFFRLRRRRPPPRNGRRHRAGTIINRCRMQEIGTKREKRHDGRTRACYRPRGFFAFAFVVPGQTRSPRAETHTCQISG